MRIALIVVPLVLIAAFAGFIAWKILGLKQRLVTELETALHATAQIGSLNLDISKGELLAANISLQNQRADAPWDTAGIDQAEIHFHFSDLFSSTLPVQVNIHGWKAAFHTTAQPLVPAPDANAPAPPASVPPPGSSWVRVTEVSSDGGEVSIRTADSQAIKIHGVGVQSDSPGGANWTTLVKVLSIDAGTLAAQASSIEMHSDASNVTFNNLNVHVGDGMVVGSGTLDLVAPHALKANFTATNVPMTMLLNTRWQVKLSGLVFGTLSYEGDDSNGSATGHLSVHGGKFNLFPWLGKATMLVGLPDVGGMEVDKAESDIAWKNHVVTLTNIDVRKESIFRISGEANVAADETIDGHLKLGLPTSAVSKWPKLQTAVFSTPQEDFSWADVHVTGTPESPQEDLSTRLLTVGAEQGTDVIKQGVQKATDLINQILK